MKLFIDMMCPSGHITINQFYLKNLASVDDVLICGHHHEGYFPHVRHLPVVFLKDFRTLPRRLMLAQKIFRLIRKLKPTTVVFLSYDLFTVPRLSKYCESVGVPVYMFEHNTVPTNPVKVTWQQYMGRHPVHMVYTDYMNAFFEILGLRTLYVPHPLLSYLAQGGVDSFEVTEILARSHPRPVVFAPSGSCALSNFLRLVESLPDLYFVIKSNEKITLENLFVKPHFNDYRDIIELSDFVWVPFNRADKVSGVAFDALAFGKKVLVEKNTFGQFLKTAFPSNVFFDFNCALSANHPKGTDIATYNSGVIEKLRSVFLGGG